MPALIEKKISISRAMTSLRQSPGGGGGGPVHSPVGGAVHSPIGGPVHSPVGGRDQSPTWSQGPPSINSMQIALTALMVAISHFPSDCFSKTVLYCIAFSLSVVKMT